MLSANFGFSAIDNKQSIFGMGDAAATDANGNAYLMASDGIYKYAPDGTQLWSTSFSNIGFVIGAREQNESVAVDSAGDVYISGGYHSTATFGVGPGAITLNSVGGTDDVFLAKLDSNGNLLWAESFGGPQDDDGLGLAVDPAGNAYVSGFFDKSANFGGITLVGNNSLWTSAFVAKVSPSGSVDWAKGYSGFNLGFIGMDARGVAVDSSGNVYTTGYFTGTVNFGSTPTNPLGNSLTSSAFFGSEYVLKLDNNGNTVWADGSFDTDEVTGGLSSTIITGKAGGTGIAVDPAGNVYATGFVSGTANFDPLGGAAGQVETPFGNDGYVLKLDSTGRFDWVDDFQDTAAFSLGFNGVEPTGIAVDVYGNVYTTGAFEATANFNPQGVTSTSSAGGFNAYVSALDTRGQFRWLGTGTGLGDDYGYGIAVAPNHNVYVAGTFVNNFTLNPGPTPPAPLTGNGGFNSAFLWGLTQPAVTGTVWDDSADKNGVRDPGEPGVAGAVVNIYASASGLPTTNPNALVATAVTDSQGNYSFLPLNNTLKYDVQVRPPAGYGFTVENAGTAGQTRSEVDGTGLSNVFPVTTNSIEVDAGLVGVQHPFGWALGVPTVGSTAGTSIATDASGNVYVAGTFKGTQDFDPGPGTYLITSGNFGNAINDFVAKYTATGALLWVRTTSSNTDQVGADPNAAPKLAIDPITGDVDVLTLITGRTDFNPLSPGTNLVTPLTGYTSTVVLWNLDSQGNVRSARSMVGGQADAAGGLAIDSSGNVYISGAFSNTADFDPGSGIKNLTSNGKDDIFVTKLTENGTLVWAQSFGGVGNDQVNSLAVDALGNVVITGSFQGSVKFGPYTLSGGAAPASTAFVAKLLGSAPPPVPPATGPTGGFPLWAVSLPGATSSVGNGVTVNQATGEIYSTGTEYASATPGTPGTAYFWKITGNGGYYQPALVLSTGDSAGRGVTVDAAGNAWATGSFSGTANFDLYATSGAVNLTSNGAHDAYLMKIGFNGFGLLQADQFGGPGEDTANAVAVDSSGNVYLTGSSHGPANFDPGLATLDTFTIGSPGEQDDFVARLNVPPTIPPDATPTFNLTTASVTVLENSAPYTQTGFATNIVPGAIGALPGPKGENDQSLNFVVSNTNSSLFAVQPGIDPTTGTLTFTPALDQSGTATVFVTLVDDAGARFTQLFTINVTFVNLPPSFVVNPTLPNSGDQTVNEDSGAQIVASWAANMSAGPGNGDVIPPNNTLQFNITDTNPALYAPGGFPTIDPTTGNLSYTLAPDQSGSDVLTVTLSDSGGTANGGVDTSTPLTFRINALFVNDPPTFTPGSASITTNEDAGAVSVPGWATNISPGEGANEQSQKAGLYFTLQNDHPELFSVLPAIDPATGNLTFTPMPDAASFNVVDHITVLLHDTSGTANGGVNVSAAQSLAITVQFVNDPPTFQINPALPNGGNQVVRFDSSNQTVANFATGLSPGPANEAGQSLNFVVGYQITAGDPNLFSAAGAVPPTISIATNPVTGLPTGTLNYKSASGLTGTATVTVQLHDSGGTANGGVDLSAPQTFTIDIEKIDIPPTFAPGGDQQVNENAGPQSVVWANPATISAGPADESNQKLRFVTTYQILSGDTDLFSGPGGAAPSIDPTYTSNPDGVLTYTPAANRSGVANVSVYLQDDGGTAFGGIDRSPVKTFRITVAPINTAPSFTLATNTVNVDEDTQGVQSVAGLAGAISPGLGPDEINQTLNFQVAPTTTADATEAATLFAIPPAIDAKTGNLTYELEPNVDGTVNFTVTLQDNGSNVAPNVNTSLPRSLTFNVNFVNDLPVLTGLSDQVLLENTTGSLQPVQSVPITLSPGLDANEQQQHWTVTVSNDNAALFATTPQGQPAITPSTGLGTLAGALTYQLAPNRSGVANLTVTLTDDGVPDQGVAAADSTPLSITQKFRIIVSPVNTPPQFQFNPAVVTPPAAGSGLLPSLTAKEDDPAQTLTKFLTGITPGADPAEAGQKVTFQTSVQSSTNPNLFVIPPSIDANGTLSYALAPDQNGSAVISVVAHDDGGTLNGGVDTSQPQLFTINALYVNDPPTFTSSGDQTVNENAGVQQVPRWATGMSPGEGANEIGQTLHFLLKPNDPTSSALFLIQPAIDAAGNLTYSPAPFAHGTASFTVTLVDNGGTANGGQDTSTPHPLTITINYVNAAPLFAKGLDQVVDEDSGPHTVSNWATGISDGPGDLAGQTLTFHVQAADAQSAALFSAGPSIDSSGNLTFTPAPLTSGVGKFTATLSDNGSSANGGQTTSVAETFHITVNPIDHAPTLANSLGNVVVDENANANSFNDLSSVFNDVDIPNGDKLALSLAGNTNPGLVTAVLTGNDPATAKMTFNYQPNQSGTAVIDLQATDQSGKTADDKITVTVLAVNQPPSFTAGRDVQVGDTAVNVVIPGWATNISAGPPSEASQTLTFQVTGNTNPALFAVAPSVDPANGNLTFATRPGVLGSAAITLVLKDSGGTANGGQDTSPPQTFNIAVAAIPTARPDSYLLGLGASDTVSAASGVLSNDSASGGAMLTAQLVQGPAHGTLTLNADGSFTYVKGPGFDGLDQFTYEAVSGGTASSPVTVQLESYEASIVDKVYHQVLGRAADTAGLQYWTAQIEAGQPYGNVAQGIFESDEHLDPIIKQYYQQFLLRQADTAGVAYWDQVWKQFGGPENVIAGMISSPEFFQAAGGTNSGWVSALYERLLNRTADQQGLQHWVNQLNQHLLTEPQVVLQFEDSVENDKILVNGFYQEYLQRGPTPDELNGAVAQLQAGATPRDIQIGIINSTEYRNTPAPPPPGTGQKLS